jgi:hypothetical protein
MKKSILLAGIIFLIVYSAVCHAGDDIRLSPGLLKPLPLITNNLPAATDNAQPSGSDRSFIDMSKPAAAKEISMKKAMFLSILVPGAGEYYAGSTFKGQVFMGVELAIWSGFIAYRIYGGWKKNDYKDYASVHAGLDNSGKDDEFYDWVGFYDSREEFNLLGRLYYPDRPYLPDTRYYHWQWESEKDRFRFKDLKDASRKAFRNSTFMLGLAALNRLVSGIDTYRTVRAARRTVSSLTQFGDYKLKVSPRLSAENPGVKISLSRKF